MNQIFLSASIIIIMLTLNYIIYRRSARATFVELYLRITSAKQRTLERRLKTFNKTQKKLQNLPKVKCNIKKEFFEDMPVFVLSPKRTKTKQIILFLHGGAYVNHPTQYHWKFCAKLCRECNATIVFPLYPLAPRFVWKDANRAIIRLYGKILVNSSKVISIMGDSAGGGLAVALCMDLAKYGITQPSKTVLLSPWLDVSMKNEKMKAYDKSDPMLDAGYLAEIGKIWAEDIGVDDYRVSPINGEVDGLNNICLFAGTREILLPDITKFYQNLKSKNIYAELIIGKGLTHDYPLYPIPEAKEALVKINEFLNKN